jgi:hypothetical protein
MHLPDNLGQLTYCLNIHPAETWDEARAALLGPVRSVRRSISPDAPFAVGLRLSAQALRSLAPPASRAELMCKVTCENALEVYGKSGQIHEQDWLNPPGIDQRTLFEDNSILRGGREPRIEAPGKRRGDDLLIE